MDDYCLVDCGFHDQLEALATLHQLCQITYRNAAEEVVEVRTQIVDVYAANKADWLKLKDGTEIRLDRAEAALPAEDLNIGIVANPFDASAHTTAQHILIGLAKIGLAVKSQSWQDAGQQGLTPTQGQILALLIDKGETGTRLSDVAKNLSVTAATASDAVTSLVEKGLVQKTRSPQDGRAIAITLTPEGHQAAAQTSSWSDFLLNTMDELSDEEQVIFLRGLIKIIRKLQAQGQISIARMCVTCAFFQPNRYANVDRPHHCALVNAPFGDRNLRLNCPEHVAAEAEVAQQNWELYLS